MPVVLFCVLLPVFVSPHALLDVPWGPKQSKWSKNTCPRCFSSSHTCCLLSREKSLKKKDFLKFSRKSLISLESLPHYSLAPGCLMEIQVLGQLFEVSLASHAAQAGARTNLAHCALFWAPHALTHSLAPACLVEIRMCRQNLFFQIPLMQSDKSTSYCALQANGA